MKYNVKKLIATFMAATLIAAGSANCMFVGAEELPNTGGVPYDEEKANFILNGTDPEHPVPEVTMGIAVGEDVPPTPVGYDLTLDWGAMALKYTFTVDGENEDGTPKLTGGSWGKSFDGTNNQIIITNNSTTEEIKGSMTYTNTVEDRPDGSENIDEYDVGIKLADYDITTSKYSSLATVKQYTLSASGNTGNSATYYIYDNDNLYDKVSKGEMPAPTESIANVKVGIITVEAAYNQPEA